MEVIFLQTEAFYTLVEQVVSRLSEKNNPKQEKWVGTDDAMDILKIKSKTTLQTLRNEDKIRFTHPQKKIILYDRYSLNDYLEKHANETF